MIIINNFVYLSSALQKIRLSVNPFLDLLCFLFDANNDSISKHIYLGGHSFRKRACVHFVYFVRMCRRTGALIEEKIIPFPVFLYTPASFLNLLERTSTHTGILLLLDFFVLFCCCCCFSVFVFLFFFFIAAVVISLPLYLSGAQVTESSARSDFGDFLTELSGCQKC